MALHIHGVGFGTMYQAFLPRLPLLFQGWVEEVLHKGHVLVEIVTTRKAIFFFQASLMGQGIPHQSQLYTVILDLVPTLALSFKSTVSR